MAPELTDEGTVAEALEDDLGQVLAAVELVTEDDTVGCDLVLARGWVMGAPAGFENGQCAFEPEVSSEELEQMLMNV